MRWILAGAALVLAGACDSSTVSVNGHELEGGAGGYTLEIRASEFEQSYLVIAPDGRVVGARAAEGVSALMDADRAQALAGEAPPEGDEDVPEVMSLRVPGFEMSIAGSSDDGGSDDGRVAMRIGGGRTNIVVNADEGGPGDADDRAYVRIEGVDETAVRDFIADADELSPAVQARMLAELDLD
jgi:hypothetical protein